MSGYRQDVRLEGGVLYVRLSGTFPNELLEKGGNVFQPLIDACSAHRCKKVLVDARELRVSFNTMAMFRAGEDAVSLSGSGLRVALLARADMLDSFFADVAANRGGFIGVFTDIDAAHRWLEE